MIANPLFASFTTTASKSRVNFLKLLRAPHEEYVWGEDALMYAEFQGLSLELRARLAGAARKGIRLSERLWRFRRTGPAEDSGTVVGSPAGEARDSGPSQECILTRRLPPL